MTEGMTAGTAGLHRLRRRLTAVFAAAAAVVLMLFVGLLLATSTRLTAERLDSDLAGAASRATALIYDDDDGRTQTEGLADDELAERGMPILVVSRDGRGADRVLLEIGAADRTSALALAATAIGTPPEDLHYGTVRLGGHPRRAVALAWLHDDDRPGGAVVVTASGPVGVTTDRLFAPAVAGGAAVLVLLATVTWFVAGRSLRPAAEALAERETFLSTAAHELRGPVARLRAGAEAARRTLRPGDPAAAALGRLVTVADSAAHVVSNLLLATRAERGEMPVQRRPVDVAELAADLEYTYPTVLVDVVEPVLVDGDAALLRHALGNLVDNAIRHGRVGDALPSVEVQVRRGRGGATVRVTDDGPGFPPDVDVLARYRSGPGGGTGLGLPLVAWIVDRHGGTLTLADAPRRGGACVEIRLPLSSPSRHDQVQPDPVRP
jgi:two-component system, OmpR family, sensor kinase